MKLLFFFSFLVSTALFAKEESIKIFGPTKITQCQNHLWVYSVGEKEIVEVIDQQGLMTIARRIPTSDNFVTALSCFKNSLLVGVERLTKERKKETQLLMLNLDNLTSKIQFKEIKSTIRSEKTIYDISCGDHGCAILQELVHLTPDLEKWTMVVLPDSGEVERLGQNKELNPFSDWQDKLLIGVGRYIALSYPQKDKIDLLDGLRSQVIVGELKEDGLPVFKKWGKKGGREGSLFFPKDISILPGKSDQLIISDVGLRHLFYFKNTGLYLGKIAIEEGFKYPMSFVATPTYIYVVDFLADSLNRITLGGEWGGQRISGNSSTQTSDKVSFLYNKKINKDLSYVRCLNCHDGTEVNTIERFLGNRIHHPVGIEIKRETNLPLSEGKYIACNTCHNQHHGVTVENGSKLPSNLRMSKEKLCLSCHEDKASLGFNHLKMEKTGKKIKPGVKFEKELNCFSCHKMHASHEHILIESSNNLCLSCHVSDQMPKSHPFGKIEKARKVDEVNCISCHSPHQSGKSVSFAWHGNNENDEKRNCLGCHDELKKFIESSPHLNQKISHDKKWSKPENQCLNCHSPHDKNTVSKDCVSCHKSYNQFHNPINPLIYSDRAQGVHFKNGSISCTTCHEHHVGEKQFLKNKESVLNFCSSCHGEKTTDLFQKFHTSFKKGSK